MISSLPIRSKGELFYYPRTSKGGVSGICMVLTCSDAESEHLVVDVNVGGYGFWDELNFVNQYGHNCCHILFLNRYWNLLMLQKFFPLFISKQNPVPFLWVSLCKKEDDVLVKQRLAFSCFSNFNCTLTSA